MTTKAGSSAGVPAGKAKPSGQDNRTSMDGDPNGAFTEKLLEVWSEGAFQGSYDSFHARIRAALPHSRSPDLFVLGRARAFLAQKPFTV